MYQERKESDNGQRHERKLVVDTSYGLHARPACMLVKQAQAFVAEIHIESNLCRVSAKSIMGVLSLGAGHGTKVTVTAEGHDALEAIREIEDLFARGFDEEQ